MLNIPFGIEISELGNQSSRYIERVLLEQGRSIVLKGGTPDLVLKPDTSGVTDTFFEKLETPLHQLVLRLPQTAVISFQSPEKPRVLIASPDRDELVHDVLMELLSSSIAQGCITRVNFVHSPYRYK